MKKFKKLAIVMVAVVTLIATTINACAAENWLYFAFDRGSITAEYYSANNWFDYYDSYKQNYLHVFTFSDVDKTIMEGNVVLTVDFDDPDTLYELRQDGTAYQFMNSLYLKDSNGKFITEGKYPLTVSTNAPKGCLNVFVDTNWRVFNNFDMTKGCYAACGVKYNYFNLYFQINDMIVLPSYSIVLKEITSSSNPAEFTGKFLQNYSETYRKNRQEYNKTCGNVEFLIPPEYAGKSFYAYINGMKVGKVTLPKKFGEKASLVNY